MAQSQKKHQPISIKKLIIISTISLTAFIIFIAFLSYLRRPTTLEIFLAPSSATIKINELNTTTQSGFTIIKPGDYTATVSAPNFKSKELSFHINPHTNNIINLALSCNHDTQVKDLSETDTSDYSCYENNSTDLDALLYIAKHSTVDQTLSDYAKYQTSVQQIKAKLPLRKYYNQSDTHTQSFKDLQYTIIADGSEVGLCQKHTFCLVVYGTNQSKDDVSNLLKQSKFDINDYEIIYDQK